MNTIEPRDSLEQLIAGELQRAFAKLKGRRNTPQLRKSVAQAAQEVLLKYRQAGIPIAHVRGLLDVGTQRFYIRIEYPQETHAQRIIYKPCTKCNGTLVVRGKPVHPDRPRTMPVYCWHCRGSGLEPLPFAQVLEFAREIRSREKTLYSCNPDESDVSDA